MTPDGPRHVARIPVNVMVTAAANRLTVTITGIRGSATADLDREYSALRRAYNQEVQERGLANAGEPPPMPGLRLLAIRPRLTLPHPIIDTEASSAGGGTEWNASWACWPRDPAQNLFSVRGVWLHFDEGTRLARVHWHTKAGPLDPDHDR